MSDSEKAIICPNCGFNAVNNYCSECGQKTHLHKETFWGLVAHFIGDYFHYDSKFWQTLKALWFSPGKLTLAYWNKQRMRYIPPVSLYIFISAVYFLLSFSMSGDKINTRVNSVGGVKLATSNEAEYAIPDDSAAHSKFDKYVIKQFRKINTHHGNFNEFLAEKVTHNFPKFFFFMIPVMAVILKLLFMKRKNFFFVDHAIFALHYHSFWFSLFTLNAFNFPDAVKISMYIILFVLAVYYMMRALRNVYNIGWPRTVLSTIVLGISYGALLTVTLLSYVLLVIVLA